MRPLATLTGIGTGLTQTDLPDTTLLVSQASQRTNKDFFHAGCNC